MSRSPTPGAAQRIRDSLAQVQGLRQQPLNPGHQAALLAIKQLQAERFRHTYADFLADEGHAPAARFFLDELYGTHDFTERDTQFGRIAGALERLFPDAVAELAVDLAQTHALTERLDHQMALHWMAQEGVTDLALRYTRSWQLTGEPTSREHQLSVVLHMGDELQRLTRIRSLRMALRMMRRPAHAAGMADLQRFLEDGFDAFAAMADAPAFLQAIAQREQAWIDRLFSPDVRATARALAKELDQLPLPL